MFQQNIEQCALQDFFLTESAVIENSVTPIQRDNISSSSQLIQVKFLKNGLLLIFAPCLRRATGHLPAITALFL